MDTMTVLWAAGVLVLLALLLAVLQSLRFRGCGYWLVFMFWGGLAMWAVMMFLDGRVHL